MTYEFASLLRDWSFGIFLVSIAIVYATVAVVESLTKRRPDIEPDIEKLLDVCGEIADMMSAQHDYVLHEVAHYRSALMTAAAMTKNTDPDLSASLLKLIK